MDYLKSTRKELIKICQEKGIKGYSGKKKDELTKMIQQNNTQGLIQKSDLESDVNVEPQVKVLMTEDTYTKELLIEQFALHRAYVIGRINTTKKIGVKVRRPSIPEDISENTIKQILHNHLNDNTSKWDCKNGDLESQKEGKQECKCFTSDGPLSFTPSSDWDVIYFLDARNWLCNKFILHRVSLKRTSSEWLKIKVNKRQTFDDQSKQGRRPRITWESLHPQISSYCTKVYEGTFEDIFIPLEEVKE